MTTATDVLNVARSQIGYHEGAGGANKFGAAYGMNGVAWCAEFQWWCFTTAGAGALIPKTAYTPTFAQWFKDRGAAPSSPAPGDLVFYDWPGDGIDRISHVGLVEAVINGSTIQTIEGNTTSGSGGNQSDGGFVARRVRSTSAVKQYGRPAYSGVSQPVQPPAFDPNTLPTLSEGMQGNAHVRNLQNWIHVASFNPPVDCAVTGNYLGETTAAVAALQRQFGITGSDANGKTVGPRTKAAFAARGGRW